MSRILAILVVLSAIASPCMGRLVGGHTGKGKGHDKESTAQQMAERTQNSLAEVIQLLTKMLSEFDRQADEDRHNWETYSKWSQDTETEKRNFIQDQEALVMSTTATLSANRQQVQQLTQDLATLDKEILDEQQSLQELNQMRHDEHQQFQVSMEDVTKTITAVSKAMEILQGQYAASGTAALAEIRNRVQVALTMFGRKTASATQQNVQALSSMLQTGGAAKNPDHLSVDGGDKYGTYQKSGGAGGVIGMLDDLKSQLESQRNDLIATESNAQREYESTKTSKETNISQMQHTHTEKSAKKGDCEATIQQCISTIDQANHEITEAKAYLAQLLVDRANFEKQFGDRVSLRSQERGATQAALDALQSVSAGAKSGVGLVQAAPSLLQTDLVSVSNVGSHTQIRITAGASKRVNLVLAKLVDLGREMDNPVLTQLASHLKQEQQQTGFDGGAFGPVLKLLNDLITRLETEAAAETSQHDWCETEKATSEAAKEAREKSVHQLMATIESLTTEVSSLKSEVEFLESEIVRVKEETVIAKEIRASEHGLYVQAKSDHEEVIAAIQQALSALSGQYGLIQEKAAQPTLNATPFAAYSAGGAGAASALSMLEDLLERYGEALRTILSDEEAALKAHVDLLARNAQFLKDCINSKNAKTSERRSLINQLGDDKGEMKTNMLELHQTGQYLMDLRPSCDDIRSTYEERTKRREAEIAALKEALQVISDPTALA